MSLFTGPGKPGEYALLREVYAGVLAMDVEVLAAVVCASREVRVSPSSVRKILLARGSTLTFAYDGLVDPNAWGIGMLPNIIVPLVDRIVGWVKV